MAPKPHRIGAFGASIFAHSALSFCGPQCKILATALRNRGRQKSDDEEDR